MSIVRANTNILRTLANASELSEDLRDAITDDLNDVAKMVEALGTMPWK